MKAQTNFDQNLRVRGVEKKKPRLGLVVLLTAAILLSLYYTLSGNSNADRLRASGFVDPVYKVVIDPGHGGKDNGATSFSHHYEKDYTLSLSQKVKELSEQEPQIEVYMTRTDDSFISSNDRERPAFANQLEADLFISIHGNTYSDPDVSGTETYYYHKESLQLASILHKHVVEATRFRDRGVKKEDYFVIKDTVMPAVLLELGYLTNPQNEDQLLKDDVQYQIAASIIDGIKEYLNIK